MTKYILVYKSNEANDWSTLPEPEIKQIVQAWGEWVGSIGDARKDGDAFKFGGKSATKDGTKDADNLLTGYAIIEAKDFDEALGIAQKAPNVQAGTGTIEVYEAFGF
jgi:hypothetical protein